MKVFLIYGGKSAEHDISVISARAIAENIYYEYYEVTPVYISRTGEWAKGPIIRDKEHIPSLEEMRYLLPGQAEDSQQDNLGRTIEIEELREEDVIAFPVLHGPYGEDGTIQGFFETLAIPYVGSGVLASATGMDKYFSKILFEKAGIPQVPYEHFYRKEWEADRNGVLEDVHDKLRFPIFIKPSNLGSSVGISQAWNVEEVTEGIDLAFNYDNSIVVEQGIEARELEVAVLGNEDIHTSVVGELIKDEMFYDYESKYIEDTVKLGIPTDLDEETALQIRDYAARAFQAIEGSGLSRVDFFLTADNEIFINEINTFPGFTEISMYPLLWEETGLSYGDLIEELIQLGLKRFEKRQSYALEDRR